MLLPWGARRGRFPLRRWPNQCPTCRIFRDLQVKVQERGTLKRREPHADGQRGEGRIFCLLRSLPTRYAAGRQQIEAWCKVSLAVGQSVSSAPGRYASWLPP